MLKNEESDKVNHAIAYMSIVSILFLMGAAVSAEFHRWWVAGALCLVSLGILILNFLAFISNVVSKSVGDK